MNSIVKLMISIIGLFLFYSLLVEGLQIVDDRYFNIGSRSSRLIYVLLRVALIYVVLIPWMKIFYRESLFEYLGTKPRNWRHDFLLAQIFLVALFLFSEPLFLWVNRAGIQFVWETHWGRWILWAVPLLIVIMLQSSAEEFLFRGFFQHKLAQITDKRWLYIGLPALFWALPHQSIPNQDLLKFGMVVQMFVMGLILGDWTARTGNIRAPILVHLFLNVFSMLIFGNSIRPTDNYILNVNISELPLISQFAYLILTALAAAISYHFYIKPRLRINDSE